MQAAGARAATLGLLDHFPEAVLLARRVVLVAEAPVLPLPQLAVDWRLRHLAHLGLLQRALAALPTLVVAGLHCTVPLTHEGRRLRPLAPAGKRAVQRYALQAVPWACGHIHLRHVGAGGGIPQDLEEGALERPIVRNLQRP